MELHLPDADGYSGIVLDGHRMTGAGVQRVWSVIVKRAYAFDGAALVPDAGGEALRFADETQPPPPDPPLGPDDPKPAAQVWVTHEGDLTVFKPQADFAVLGHLPNGNDGGQIRVDNVPVLTRTIPHAGDADATRHLFGFEPRAGVASDDAATQTRPNEGGTWPDTPGSVPLPGVLPGDYDNRFANFQRRSVGYSEAPLFQVPNTAAIAIHRTDDASDTALALALDLPVLSAEHLTYFGHGPDRQSRWCPTPVGTLRPDTLVVNPAAETAYVVWRAVWPYADEPADRYRRLTVREEAA